MVRELGEHGQHFLLVKPGSVDQMAQAVLQLHADPRFAQPSLGGRAARTSSAELYLGSRPAPRWRQSALASMSEALPFALGLKTSVTIRSRAARRILAGTSGLPAATPARLRPGGAIASAAR